MAILTQSHLADRGSEIALVDETHSVTWAELDERVNRLVNGLRSHGLTTGDTIAVIAGNQCEWFEIAMACAHGGWTYVPVNWHWLPMNLPTSMPTPKQRSSLLISDLMRQFRLRSKTTARRIFL